MTQSIQSLFNITEPSPMQRVNAKWTQFDDGKQCSMQQERVENASHQVELWCKRDDLLHPIISGNKWRKLLKPLTDFRQDPPNHVLSFGGPYSNHLHALAYCCYRLNIKFTAIIRGAYLSKQTLNPTLSDLKAWNTNLIYVDKQTYQRKSEVEYLQQLRHQLDVDTVIPEGGSQQDALLGMKYMLEEIALVSADKKFDAIILPVGSGASMAGIVKGCDNSITNEVIGIGVLNGKGYLEGLVSQFLGQEKHQTSYLPWRIEHDFHFGGYAKTTPELDAFCYTFNQQQITEFSTAAPENHNIDTPIVIEPVYSGKCFYAVKSLIQRAYFAPNSRILVIHTGGMQGARAYQHTSV